MKNEPILTHETLCRLSGFHQYRLTSPAMPTYVSPDLCHLLGLPEAALLGDSSDLYAARIHPADREAYNAFLTDMTSAPRSRTAEYRLIRGDGTAITVRDAMSSYILNGIMMADSVLTDITDLKQENRNLQYLNDTTPCGFLKYTCERIPRITYINDRMKAILGLPERSGEEFDPLEMYLSNIYTMIPADERGRFARYLERVSEQGTPLAGEMTALRPDGRRIRIFGWVTKCVDTQGRAEFQSAFMDVTERYRERREQETSRYLKALTEVYDKIFEYDFSSRTVRCLHSSGSPAFRPLENLPMQMEEATSKWISDSVDVPDRERVRRFFEAFFTRCLHGSEGRPPQITYRAASSSGGCGTYTGILLKLSEEVHLYCCRRTPEPMDTGPIRELALRFTEGVVAFEVDGDHVRPMYISENVCSFFGYSREAWLALADTRPTIREFIARSGIDYADVRTLFSAGEAEFSYFDMEQGAYRRIRAICSQDQSGGGKRYVMLYNLDPKEPEPVLPKVRIRTFGYFDVFVDDKPIAFRNEKSKELLALLVDRRGGFVSSEEAISYLWEDEPADPVTLSRYRKVALRLKNNLEEHGIAAIVESVGGRRRIAAERIRCDLYDYLTGREEFAQLFKGSYLTNYSWGEHTLAELTGAHLLGGGE